jgi:hypothetical protein
MNMGKILHLDKTSVDLEFFLALYITSEMKKMICQKQYKIIGTTYVIKMA